MSAVETTAGRGPAPGRLSMAHARRRVRGWRANLPLAVGTFIFAVVALSAILAGLIAPSDPNAVELQDVLLEPSSAHLAGTDGVGRDVLSRLMHGGRISLVVAGGGMVGSLLVGTVAGLLSAFGGRAIELVILRLIDVQLAFPYILIAIAITSAIRPNVLVLIGLMVLAGWAGAARVVRSVALQERAKDYVKAARVVGASRWRIARKYVFPSVLPSLLALAPVQMSVMIVFESTLSFLGMGVQPPTATWGGIMLDGKVDLSRAWWLTTLPGIVIFVTSLGLILLGDGIQRRIGQRIDVLSGTVATADDAPVEVKA